MANINKTFYILLCILIVAFTLRLWGLWHGYPFSYYPDEAHLVKRALAFGSGDLNPHWFHKPALFLYLLFFEYGIFFIVGKIVGLWQSVTDFAVYYIVTPGPFYIIGRFTVVVFSVGSVALTWFFGKQFFSKTTAWVAALLMAVSFGPIVTAKDIKLDAPCAFFTLLSCYLLCLFLNGNKDSKSRRFLLLATIVAGIGSATKVYSVVMLLPISVVIVFFDVGTIMQRLRRVGFHACILFFTYFICSPFNFLDPHGRKSTFGHFFKIIDKINFYVGGGETKQIEGVSREIQNLDHSVWDFITGFLDYLQNLAIGLNPLVLLLCLVGFCFLLTNRHRIGLIFIIFPLVFMGISIFLNPGYANLRHQSPIYPFIALLAGYAVHELSRFIILHRAIVVLLICFLIYDVGRIASYNNVFSQRDIRNIAKEWVESNIPSGTKLLLDEEGPVLRKSTLQLKDEIEFAQSQPLGPFTTHYGSYLDYQMIANKGKVTYDIFEIRLPWWRSSMVGRGLSHLDSDVDADMGNPLRPVGVLTYDEYLKENYEYAVLQSDKFSPFVNGRGKDNFPAYYALYNDLLTRGKIVKSFTGDVPTGHSGKVSSLTVNVIKLQ